MGIMVSGELGMCIVHLTPYGKHSTTMDSVYIKLITKARVLIQYYVYLHSFR